LPVDVSEGQLRRQHEFRVVVETDALAIERVGEGVLDEREHVVDHPFCSVVDLSFQCQAPVIEHASVCVVSKHRSECRRKPTTVSESPCTCLEH